MRPSGSKVRPVRVRLALPRRVLAGVLGRWLQDEADRQPAAGWDTLATDGSVAHIRPVRPEDEDALRALNERVSDRTIYLRFFTINRRGADEQAHHLSAPDPGHTHDALVAEVGGRIVAVGSFELIVRGEAEVAFLVDDAFHGRGLGTLLLEQLAATAREHGVHHLRADTLVENAPMLRVFADSGFEQVRTMASGVVELSLDTAYGTAHARPDGRPGARRRGALAGPAARATVGRGDRAGRRPGGIGHEVLLNLLHGGFTGRLAAVNPHTTAIAGVPTYLSIAAVPGPVELAVIAVPAEEVAAIVEECGPPRGRGRGRPDLGLRRDRNRRRCCPARGSDGRGCTACGWSARTASAWSTPPRRCG